MNIKIFIKEYNFIQSGTDLISDICRKQENVSIALSGGSTPGELYKSIAEDERIPFEKINLWQVDERYVPKNSSDSNYKLISDTILAGERKPKSFHHFDTSLKIDEALNKYEKELNEYGKPFDLTILGVGEDGHTASLFPNSDALKEKDKKVAHTTTGNHKIKDRLTLTFPQILSSKAVLILLQGDLKEATLNEFTSGLKSSDEFPVKKLLMHPDLHIHYLR